MKSTLHMVATLVLVGVFSGGALSLVNDWAQPIIQENQTGIRDEAVTFLVPGGRPDLVIDRDGLAAWRVMDGREIKGWAVRYSGIGFEDRIDLLFALDAERRHIIGMKVLSDKETPGLGTWIRLRPEHEAAMQESGTRELGAAEVNDNKNYPLQFFGWGGGRRLNASGELKVVKNRQRTDLGPDEVQAITAATISSQAVVSIINEAVVKLDSLLAKEGGEQ